MCGRPAGRAEAESRDEPTSEHVARWLDGFAEFELEPELIRQAERDISEINDRHTARQLAETINDSRLSDLERIEQVRSLLSDQTVADGGGFKVQGFAVGEADPMRRATGCIVKGLAYLGDLVWCYGVYCSVCHGGNAISGGIVPDLRYRIGDLDPAWQSIVIDGAFSGNGMPAWNDYLSSDEADAIRVYVAHEARLGHQRGERRLVRR